MILPSKHLPEGRSLIGIGSEILVHLQEPISVSELWERVRRDRSSLLGAPSLSYDTFILALTFLHMIFAINLDNGLIAVQRAVA